MATELEQLAQKVYEHAPQEIKPLSNQSLELLLSAVSQFARSAQHTTDPAQKYLSHPHRPLAARLGWTGEELLRVLDCILRYDAEMVSDGGIVRPEEALERCKSEQLQVRGARIGDDPESFKRLCTFMRRTGWFSQQWEEEESRRAGRKRAATPAPGSSKPMTTMKAKAGKQNVKRQKTAAPERPAKRRKLHDAETRPTQEPSKDVEQKLPQAGVGVIGPAVEQQVPNEENAAFAPASVMPGSLPNQPLATSDSGGGGLGPRRILLSVHHQERQPELAPPTDPSAMPQLDISSQSASRPGASTPTQAKVHVSKDSPTTSRIVAGGDTVFETKIPFTMDQEGYRNGIKLETITESINMDLLPTLESEVKSFVAHAPVFKDAEIDFEDARIASNVGLAHGKTNCDAIDTFPHTEDKGFSTLALLPAVLVQSLISAEWPETLNPVQPHQIRIETQLFGQAHYQKFSKSRQRLLKRDEPYCQTLRDLAAVKVEQELRKINLVNREGWRKSLYDVGLRLPRTIESAVEAVLRIRIGYGENRIGAVWLQAGQKVPRKIGATFWNGYGAPINEDRLPDDAVVCYSLLPAIIDTQEQKLGVESGCFIREPEEGLLLDRIPQDTRLLVPPHLVIYSEQLWAAMSA